MNHKKRKSRHLGARNSPRCTSPASVPRLRGTSSASGLPSTPRSATCASCAVAPSRLPRYGSSTVSLASRNGARHRIFNKSHRLSHKIFLLSSEWLLFMTSDIKGVNPNQYKTGGLRHATFATNAFFIFTSGSTTNI